MQDGGCGVGGGVLKFRLIFFRFSPPLRSEVKLPSSTFTPTSPHLTCTSPAHLDVNYRSLAHCQWNHQPRSLARREIRNVILVHDTICADSANRIEELRKCDLKTASRTK